MQEGFYWYKAGDDWVLPGDRWVILEVQIRNGEPLAYFGEECCAVERLLGKLIYIDPPKE